MWLIVGWVALIAFAIIGVVFSVTIVWLQLADKWREKTTQCARCKSRGLLQKHFCSTCAEKIEKLIGEKW